MTIKMIHKLTFLNDDGKPVEKDFGLGAGVLATQEVTFATATKRSLNDPMFVLGVMDKKDEMINRLIRVDHEIKEITDD